MRKFLQYLAVSLLFVGVGLTAARPALAVPFCGDGFICVYDAPDGTSLMAKKYWTDWVQSICYGMTGVDAGLDNRVSYVVNDSSHDLIVALGYSCSGTTGVWYAHSHGAMNATWNNSISSWYRVD